MNEEWKVVARRIEEAKSRLPSRIGLVATDPLRILGLQEMFGGAGVSRSQRTEIIPLSIPGVLQDVSLSNVLVDASCTNLLFELIATFRRMRPQLRLLVLGDSMDPEYIQRIIGAGARGYLTQSASESEIRMALEMVNDGSVWAPRRVLARLLDATGYADGPPRPKALMTDRESDILEQLVTGLGNREIASSLGIDESTVKAHLTRLMRKAGVKNRVELTLYALGKKGQQSRS